MYELFPRSLARSLMLRKKKGKTDTRVAAGFYRARERRIFSGFPEEFFYFASGVYDEMLKVMRGEPGCEI